MHSVVLKSAVLIVLCCLLSACIPSTEIRQFSSRAPLSLQGESRSIMFKKLISKIHRGEEIGTMQVGVACIPNTRLHWKRGGKHQVGDDELSETLREELTNAGYRIVGEPNSLFEDPQEWKAEFLLAGIIKHVAVNQCFPLAGFGNFTDSSGEASIEVEWQIFERRTRSVVFTAVTGGTAEASMKASGGDEAYYSAFGASVRNLLANQTLVSLLSKQTPNAYANAPTLDFEVITVDELGPIAPSDLVQFVHGTVVTIPVGNGHGSGVIISRSGLVLTNAHVVGDGTGMVSIELATGRRVVGEVVRVNKDIDVALIQLEKGKYLAAPVKSADSLRVGDPVYAIGTPLDQRLARTVTKGIVSAFREEEGKKLIQSDVAIHPGNSGGPLLDEKGRVVGIAQSAFLSGKTGIGLNYFIPIGEAWKAMQARPEEVKVGLGELLGSTALLAAPANSPSKQSDNKLTAGAVEKLEVIKRLRDKGLIDQGEADLRTKVILDEVLR
jgi:serine protease Do